MAIERDRREYEFADERNVFAWQNAEDRERTDVNWTREIAHLTANESGKTCGMSKEWLEPEMDGKWLEVWTRMVGERNVVGDAEPSW